MRWLMLIVIVLSGLRFTCWADQEAAQVPSVRPIQAPQVASQRLLDGIGTHVVDYYRWPPNLDDDAQIQQTIPSIAAREDAVAWIKRVLQRDWVLADISPCLIGRRRDVQGYADSRTTVLVEYDAIRCRYSIGGTAIQVTQTSYAMGVLIQPSPDVRQRMTEVTILPEFAKQVIRLFINEADRVNLVTSAPTADGQVAQCKPNYRLHDLDWNTWHDNVSWWTDGKSLALLMPKCNGGPYGPSAIRDWLGH